MDNFDIAVGRWIGRPFVFLLFSVAPSIYFGHSRTPLDAAPYLVNGAVWFVVWLFIEGIMVRVLRLFHLHAENAAMIILLLMVVCALSAGISLGLHESNYQGMLKAIQGS